MLAPAESYLVLRNISPKEWAGVIEERRKVIGRSRGADIRVHGRFRSVSRRHAEVWRDQRGIWLRDLGSTCGTWVNGVPIGNAPQVRLFGGDTIWLGRLELEVVAKLEEWVSATEADGECPTEHHRLLSLSGELTPAEVEILVWLTRGCHSNDQLAKQIHRSKHTIRTQINNILHKLSVHSRTELLSHLRHPNAKAVRELLTQRKPSGRGTR